MTDDAELLRRYTEDYSEAAFAQLVERHLGLVYAVAVRRLGSDKHLADDVAQKVFIDLARKAPGMSRRVALPGWLFTSARFAASRVARTENRRRNRERKALDMTKSISEGRTFDWDLVRPLVDELIEKLSEGDRQAILLRFFEGHDYAEVGANLAMSADGARTRVNRALEKLQSMLAKRGIASTSVALSGALASQPMIAVPVGLATNITTTAMAAAGAGKGATGVLIFMSVNKAIVGITGTLVGAGIVGFVIQHRANMGLRAEIAGLRSQSSANAALRVDNARLIRSARELSDALDKAGSDRMELIHAREDVAALRQQASTAHVLSSGNSSANGDTMPPKMIPTNAWTNAGMATPAASYETAMWAHRQADVETLAKGITFGEAEKAKLDALFTTLPEAARAKWGSPEKMIALLFANGPDHAGFQVLSQNQRDENTVAVDVSVQGADGRLGNAEILFSRGTDGWRMLMPADEVADQIKKIVGEPLPKQ